MENDNIILIGMPGAGKSTLGVVLAKKLGYRFVDTDLLIQEGTGRLLSELLQEHGVEGFVQIENDIIRGLECERHVVSTGGSAVYGAEAMEHLRQMGTIVFLDIPLEELERRLSPDLMQRGVVIRAGYTLADLLSERQPLYERYADATLTVTNMGTLEAVEALYELVVKELDKR